MLRLRADVFLIVECLGIRHELMARRRSRCELRRGIEGLLDSRRVEGEVHDEGQWRG